MSEDLDFLIAIAMNAAGKLACQASAAGDLPTMYSADRAWHEMFEAGQDLAKRRSALALSPQENADG
jgi:hypothetical protein